MRNDEIRLLRNLLDDESGVPGSSLGIGLRVLVDRLSACGAARFVIGKGGRGRRLVLADRQAFERLVARELPAGLDFAEEDIVSRASAVALRADAKAFAGSITEAIVLRATKSGIKIKRSGCDDFVSVSELTAIAGCAAISLTGHDEWNFSGTIAVIENADAFWKHEIVLPDVDLAIYACGRMSGRFINWLGSSSMRNCSITHWSDYDPVGVEEYIRLQDACGDRVQVYVPKNIEALLCKFGKRDLIGDNIKSLEKIRLRKSIPYVSQMVNLFDRHHRGLEQEILLHDGIQLF